MSHPAALLSSSRRAVFDSPPQQHAEAVSSIPTCASQTQQLQEAPPPLGEASPQTPTCTARGCLHPTLSNSGGRQQEQNCSTVRHHLESTNGGQVVVLGAGACR